MPRLLLALIACLLVGAPASSQGVTVRAGVLVCELGPGFGAILGSFKRLECFFDAISVPDESYDGSITKIGVDVGATNGGRLLWAVFAPSLQVDPGALEGRYYGVTAEATPGVGLGAHVLVGGFDRSISLQPLSVQGQVGANLAAGVAALRLESPPPVVQNVFKR